ncbi:MAG TPA: glycoside hydrolase family 2 TIM barrel-domain containing protein [Rhodothermales bacterium]|nr:glycoside hydrolase family 2 TIM barrel-domain containing protein [Rhodothermales bacterium]
MYPQQNRHRTRIDLSGYWRFKPDPGSVGVGEEWFISPLYGDVLMIAVPGAWNEQLAECGLMNYVGAAWYETSVETRTDGRRIALYVGAADHDAQVWVNGSPVGSHQGGYLPFELDVSAAWLPQKPNRITIRVDSTLSMHTLPQDVDPSSELYSSPAYERRHLFPPTRFDFFPYGGLTRQVCLCVTDTDYIERIRVDSRLNGAVSIRTRSRGSGYISVQIRDGESGVVTKSKAPIVDGRCKIEVEIPSVRPWSPSDPHLYTAQVSQWDKSGAEVDCYDQRFGVREVEISGGTLLLNGKTLFLTGFGKHEDYPIVGRGQFRSAYIRDFELMRWIGANSFRTSHYPYDEEMISLADELGFLVINEVPAVSLGFWSDDLEDLSPLLENHRRALTELVNRDVNHPSVIAWSTTNEPNLWSEPHYQNEASAAYFRKVYAHTKSLDDSRPVIAIIMGRFQENDVALEACDLIGINRYFGWYTDPAQLELAARQLDRELDALYDRYAKPVIVTEFGADTVEGQHATTAQMFTEEFQQAFLMTYSRVIESKPFCAGAHVWNFADFRTPQHFRRVVLNKKGVFNRSREPKMAAFALRDYWRQLDRVASEHRPVPADPSFLIPDLRKPDDEEANPSS